MVLPLQKEWVGVTIVSFKFYCNHFIVGQILSQFATTLKLNQQSNNGLYLGKQMGLFVTVMCILVGIKSEEIVHIAEINDTTYQQAACFHRDEAFFYQTG